MGPLHLPQATNYHHPWNAVSEASHVGPYRFTRNPMYVGLIVAYFGEAGLLKQAWPIALLLLTIVYLNYVVIPLEEAPRK